MNGRDAFARPAGFHTRWASVIACLFFILRVFPLYAQEPIIRHLSPSDTVFAQLSADVEAARRLQSGQAIDVDASIRMLTVYSYTPKTGDTLLAVAARCGIPYETIVTANRIPAGGDLIPGRIILLPAAPGLFVPQTPASDLERIVAGARAENAASGVVTLRREGKPIKFHFFPGAEFTPTERAFFLNVAFRFPLPSARVTSVFGLRINPVTGNLKRHDGVDLAAPQGTEVFATRDGVVIDIGDDPVYGRYVVIEHEASWKSLYGHLSSVLTDLRKSVRSGTIIGRVGSTGQSTGAHLHFELRRNGEARDPSSLLPRGIGR
ncbi:MAG: M23 family metallopeptidase [Treponemataceae bacterium]